MCPDFHFFQLYNKWQTSSIVFSRLIHSFHRVTVLLSCYLVFMSKLQSSGVVSWLGSFSKSNKEIQNDIKSLVSVGNKKQSKHQWLCDNCINLCWILLLTDPEEQNTSVESSQFLWEGEIYWGGRGELWGKIQGKPLSIGSLYLCYLTFSICALSVTWSATSDKRFYKDSSLHYSVHPLARML